MEKKSTQKFNLAKYSAVAGVLVAGGSLNAQIVYYDINPDRELTKNSDPLVDGAIKFDSDAVTDVVFGVWANPNNGTFTSSGGGAFSQYVNWAAAAVVNGFKGSVSSSSFYPALLNNGDNIGPTDNFGINAFPSPDSAAGSVFLASAGRVTFATNPTGNTNWASGNFAGAQDAYLGVKFKIGAATHYGWIRFDVSADSKTITLKDHAYNAVADEGMLAGQMLNLDNVAVENKVMIKTHLDEAFINVTPDLVGGEMVIINMAGQEVKSAVIGDVNAKMTYEGLDSGIYTLVARFESGSVNKKIYVR